MIKHFEIKGLYGKYNISIPFPYPRKILIADNGGYKTTVLNILYATLTGHIEFYKDMVDSVSITVWSFFGTRTVFVDTHLIVEDGTYFKQKKMELLQLMQTHKPVYFTT